MPNRYDDAGDFLWPGFSCQSWMAFSGPNLFAGLLFSSIGFIGFVYGKQMSLWKPMLLGLALMAYPYFIENTILLCGLGLAGSAGLFWLRD